MVEVRKYQFDYGKVFGRFATILDDQGHERQARLATEDEEEALFGGSRETSPSEHLDVLTRQEQDRFPQLDYVQALKRVMERNPTITRAYASESAGRVHIVSNRENDVSASIAAKAQLLIEGDPQKKRFKTYSDAVRHVLSRSPELASRYASYTSEAAYRRVG